MIKHLQLHPETYNSPETIEEYINRILTANHISDEQIISIYLVPGSRSTYDIFYKG